MDCARNIITANFSGGGTSATTAPLWQWDYGQVLCITGIEDLPAAFEVHFSTNRTGGVSTVAVGADGQVTIPNVLLTIGKNLNAWIYLSDSEGEGETEYSITIPVKARPMPETYDAEVTGEFDDVVRQVSEYAETAQTAADNAGASASAAAASADNAAASASAAETAKTAAETAQGKAEDAQAAAETAAQTATQKAEQTAQDAAQAAQSKADAESAAQSAEAAETGAESAKTDAETAAQGAAASASAASASAASAGQAASAAAQSATAAAGSATTAQGAAQTATTKAGEASASATAAAASETAAQNAQTAAETAAGTAASNAAATTTKAGEAAQSASSAAQSKTDAEAAATRAETAAASLTIDSALSDTSVNPVQNKVITTEVAQVKSALSYVGMDGTFSLPYTLFTNGGLNADGTLTTQVYLASTQNDVILPFPVKMDVVDPAYSIKLLVKQSDNTYFNITDQLAIKGYTIRANVAFKFQVYKTGDFARADLSIFANQVVFTTEATWVSKVATKNMELMQRDGSQLIDATFVRGTINSVGAYLPATLYRCCTPEMFKFPYRTELTIAEGFRYAVTTYDDDGTLISDSSWMTQNVIVEPNIFTRISIAKVSEDTSVPANVWEFYNALTIQSEYKEYVDEQIGSVKEYVDEQIGSVEVNSSLLSAPIFSNGRAKLAAHTGYHVNVPENTTASYIAAGKLGYWGIESDIQQTSDGYYVMCHDTTVDRTTDGTGNIADMTLAQIRALHITGDSSLKIPTFEEYLGICKWYGCVPLIELKSTITNTKESYQKIIGIVKDFGFSEKAVLFLGSKWALENFRQASESVPFGSIYQSGINLDWDTEIAFCSQYPNVMMDWDILLGLTAARVKQAHDANIAVGTFVTDTVEQVRSAFEAGADCCTTNVVLPTD